MLKQKNQITLIYSGKFSYFPATQQDGGVMKKCMSYREQRLWISMYTPMSTSTQGAMFIST